MASSDSNQSAESFKYARKPETDPVCDSGIYCYGPLLETIQMAKIFRDSKTFVDKKLKHPPGKIIKRFEELIKSGEKLSVEQIKEFVEANFGEEGQELELWTPEDWNAQPRFIRELKSGQLRGLAKRINRLLRDLSRKIKDDVRDNSHLYSIIYVPNGFVVPGGRFREFYYWDTYWIVRALLCLDMTTTVKGILENFLIMVDTHGLVPNGGRIYYTKRSQPPFLTLMVKEYVDQTAEVDFLRKHIQTIEKELLFWEEKRSLQVEKDGEEHLMFVFGTGGTGPRPESYFEDVELAEQFKTDEEKEEFYYHMKAGAETGWDYSTRWFIDEKTGGNDGGLKSVKAHYVVPVDLNSLMFMNYTFVSEFHSMLGDAVKSEEFARKAEKLKEAIREVLWHDTDQVWYDFDLIHESPRRYFYPSNLFPLWAECYDPSERESMAEAAMAYLKRTGAIYCKGGIPTSLDQSGQQWDYPNAWPPLQHILVAGLLKTEHPEARRAALIIARRYTQGTMFSCPEGAEVCNMYEKYDVTSSGEAGGGGEYDVQTGFGWTNGVVIEFMNLFGDDLLADDGLEEEFACVEDMQLSIQFDISLGKSKIVPSNPQTDPRHQENDQEVATTDNSIDINAEDDEDGVLGRRDSEAPHPVFKTIEEDDDQGQNGSSNSSGPNSETLSDRPVRKKLSVEIEAENSKRLIGMFEAAASKHV